MVEQTPEVYHLKSRKKVYQGGVMPTEQYYVGFTIVNGSFDVFKQFLQKVSKPYFSLYSCVELKELMAKLDKFCDPFILRVFKQFEVRVSQMTGYTQFIDDF